MTADAWVACGLLGVVLGVVVWGRTRPDVWRRWVAAFGRRS